MQTMQVRFPGREQVTYSTSPFPSIRSCRKVVHCGVPSSSTETRPSCVFCGRHGHHIYITCSPCLLDPLKGNFTGFDSPASILPSTGVSTQALLLQPICLRKSGTTPDLRMGYVRGLWDCVTISLKYG